MDKIAQIDGSRERRSQGNVMGGSHPHPNLGPSSWAPSTNKLQGLYTFTLPCFKFMIFQNKSLKKYLLVSFINVPLQFFPPTIDMMWGWRPHPRHYKDCGSLPLVLCHYKVDFRYPNILAWWIWIFEINLIVTTTCHPSSEMEIAAGKEIFHSSLLSQITNIPFYLCFFLYVWIGGVGFVNRNCWLLEPTRALPQWSGQCPSLYSTLTSSSKHKKNWMQWWMPIAWWENLTSPNYVICKLSWRKHSGRTLPFLSASPVSPHMPPESWAMTSPSTRGWSSTCLPSTGTPTCTRTPTSSIQTGSSRSIGKSTTCPAMAPTSWCPLASAAACVRATNWVTWSSMWCWGTCSIASTGVCQRGGVWRGSIWRRWCQLWWEGRLLSIWLPRRGFRSMSSSHKTRATSHTRLRAHDHFTSSTLMGGKGGAGSSSLHTTLEGPTEHVNARWMECLHDFLHGIELILFHGHFGRISKTTSWR